LTFYNWNRGMMECWNDGFEGILSNQNGYFHTFYPLFQDSIIPGERDLEGFENYIIS